MTYIFKAPIIALAVMLLLTPLVAAETITIESDSMSHGSGSSSETLDPGDKVEIIKVKSHNDIITYFEGKEKGYKSFGDYGDVIAYYKNGLDKDRPVIHRAILWLEYNQTSNSFDIPELGMHNVSSQLFFQDFGYNKMNLTLSIRAILNTFKSTGEPHSGYITKGDNNAQIDQGALPDAQGNPVEPVKLSWIKGKVSTVEDQTFFIILILIISTSIIVVIIILVWIRKWKSNKRER